ncbi:MAG TPA: YidC/Oxa1 family insertase periplasmic-domain containing protein [Sedimentisphaerales bacterium]|nr:YidC/Oxa1 family insertase periplasmic-domain containing protein [Sedimentisphaerales bacterium]
MNFRTVLIIVIIIFAGTCMGLVVESGVFAAGRSNRLGCILLQHSLTSNTGDISSWQPQQNGPQEVNNIILGADDAAAKTVILGARDPATEDPDAGFKFQLALTSKGAAISKATFSTGNGKGFDNRDYKDPQPLVLLSPVQLADGEEITSMAIKKLVFVQQKLQLALNRLHWQSLPVEKTSYGRESASFEAVIKDQVSGEGITKVVQTYRVTPGNYLLDCEIHIENLSAQEQKVRFDLSGTVGISQESIRRDAREAVAGFRDAQGKNHSKRIDARKLNKAQTAEQRRLLKAGENFLWVASTNKYFAAILVPVAGEDAKFCDWVADSTGQFYDPDGISDNGDEAIGTDLKIVSSTLSAAGQDGNLKTYKFQLYLGPKDKSIFDRNPMYRDLGFVETISFMACFCCPAAIIKPLAFGILSLMKWMYTFIGNYGLVIIILVFVIRIVMHPITKKSQVSMSKLSTLGPQVEQIKKKYAHNKVEMNKQVMALYRQQGASPIKGMLPMFVQMPIWIALYSAIYASIELRGAAFLPFWITDLSAPDALVRFPAITLPLFGKLDSFNLLPILMGVAFYLQQKLMPKPATEVNPQAAQQQKMMMFMMTLMFPVMLYKAPSGLNLYIMSSVFAGVVEQYLIRKHIREKEQVQSIGLVAATSKTGGKIKKKKPKPFYKNM